MPLYAPVATVPVPRQLPVFVADVIVGASSLKTMFVSDCSIGIELPEKSIVQLRTVVDVERWFVSAAPGPFQAHGDGPSNSAVYRWVGEGPWQAVEGPLDSLNVSVQCIRRNLHPITHPACDILHKCRAGSKIPLPDSECWY